MAQRAAESASASAEAIDDGASASNKGIPNPGKSVVPAELCDSDVFRVACAAVMEFGCHTHCAKLIEGIAQLMADLGLGLRWGTFLARSLQCEAARVLLLEGYQSDLEQLRINFEQCVGEDMDTGVDSTYYRLLQELKSQAVIANLRLGNDQTSPLNAAARKQLAAQLAAAVTTQFEKPLAADLKLVEDADAREDTKFFVKTYIDKLKAPLRGRGSSRTLDMDEVDKLLKSFDWNKFVEEMLEFLDEVRSKLPKAQLLQVFEPAGKRATLTGFVQSTEEAEEAQDMAEDQEGEGSAGADKGVAASSSKPAPPAKAQREAAAAAAPSSDGSLGSTQKVNLDDLRALFLSSGGTVAEWKNMESSAGTAKAQPGAAAAPAAAAPAAAAPAPPAPAAPASSKKKRGAKGRGRGKQSLPEPEGAEKENDASGRSGRSSQKLPLTPPLRNSQSDWSSPGGSARRKHKKGSSSSKSKKKKKKQKKHARGVPAASQQSAHSTSSKASKRSKGKQKERRKSRGEGKGRKRSRSQAVDNSGSESSASVHGSDNAQPREWESSQVNPEWQALFEASGDGSRDAAGDSDASMSEREEGAAFDDAALPPARGRPRKRSKHAAKKRGKARSPAAAASSAAAGAGAGAGPGAAASSSQAPSRRGLQIDLGELPAGIPPPTGISAQQAVANLHNAQQKLSRSVAAGRDPLEDALAAPLRVAQAEDTESDNERESGRASSHRRRRRLIARQRHATKVQWPASDDETEDDDDDDDERVSSPDSTVRRASLHSAVFSVAPLDGSQAAAAAAAKAKSKSTPKPRQRRRAWTEEEEKALREGVAEFGVGKWKAILSKYTFSSRTTVNLKDKWRNLLRRDGQ